MFGGIIYKHGEFPARCSGTVADDDWGAVLSCAFFKKNNKNLCRPPLPQVV